MEIEFSEKELEKIEEACKILNTDFETFVKGAVLFMANRILHESKNQRKNR